MNSDDKNTMMVLQEQQQDTRHWPAERLYGDYRFRPYALARCVEQFQEQLVPHLRAWARHGVHFSLSPWNSPAWIGLLYGHVSRDAAEFHAHALEEYARCFSAGWIEIGPYHLPPVPSLLQINSRTGPGFGLLVAVTCEPMMYRFPHGHPDPAKRGEVNVQFLEPSAVRDAIDPLLQILGTRLRMIVLRPGRVYPTEHYPFARFLDRLDGLLAALPRTGRYAVELSTPDHLRPEYFACLQNHGAAHVIGDADDMPPLLEHVQRPDVLTSDVVILRTPQQDGPFATPGRTEGISAEVRLGILETVRRCLDEKKTLYVDLGDRPEGSAPLSLLGLMALLDKDLAKLSPLRKYAA